MKKNWIELHNALEQELADLTRTYRKRSSQLEQEIHRVMFKAAEQFAGVKSGAVLRYVKRASWVDSSVRIGDVITVRSVAFSYHETRSKVWVNYRFASPLSRGSCLGGYFVTPASLWRAFVKVKETA